MCWSKKPWWTMALCMIQRLPVMLTVACVKSMPCHSSEAKETEPRDTEIAKSVTAIVALAPAPATRLRSAVMEAAEFARETPAGPENQPAATKSKRTSMIGPVQLHFLLMTFQRPQRCPGLVLLLRAREATGGPDCSGAAKKKL